MVQAVHITVDDEAVQEKPQDRDSLCQVAPTSPCPHPKGSTASPISGTSWETSMQDKSLWGHARFKSQHRKSTGKCALHPKTLTAPKSQDICRGFGGGIEMAWVWFFHSSLTWVVAW